MDIHGQLSNNTAMELDSATPSNAGGTQAQTSQNTADTSATALPQGFTEFLNQFTNLPFTPCRRNKPLGGVRWPVSKFCLIRAWIRRRLDPEKSAEVGGGEEENCGGRERVRGEERERMEEDMKRREMERRMSVSGSVSGDRRPEPERPKVFQLETFDDDDLIKPLVIEVCQILWRMPKKYCTFWDRIG